MKRQLKISQFFYTIFLLGCLTLVSCSNSVTPTNSQPTITPQQGKAMNTNNQLPRLEGKATVEMLINGGKVLIEVDGNNAPITAGNFVDLVEKGFYNGFKFHRVVKDTQPIVAQGGDPLGNGTGGYRDPKTGQSRNIPLEIKLEGENAPQYNKALGQQAGLPSTKVVLHHVRGAVAMARSQAPDSASSQFYFALSDLTFLDGDYAVFGNVTEGMDVVDKIKQGDKIEVAKVISGQENLKQ